SALERIAVLRSASAARIGTSGSARWSTTVSGLGVVMLWISAMFERATAAVAGLRMRFNDAATSADVNGVPFWNFTFGRRLNVSVCELSVNFHDVARRGTILSFESS